MNPFRFFRKPAKQPRDSEGRTLESTMRPDPEAREKRLSQWSRERRQRYLDAAYGEPWSLRGRGT